jgi:hypothetical protein
MTVQEGNYLAGESVGCIRIAPNDPEALMERVRVSYAVPLENLPQAPSQVYKPDAIVPTSPLELDSSWREAITRHLLATPETPTGHTIEIVTIPALGELATSHTPDASELRRERLAKEYGDTIEMNGLVTSPPNDLTTSFIDGATKHATAATLNHVGKHTGIHTDNWHRMPMATRAESPRRLCLNVGLGDKDFLVALPDIVSIGRTMDLQEDEIPNTQCFAKYVRQASACGRVTLCIWVRLEPGEAYIIPAEMTPHEGSTLGQLLPSTMEMHAWTNPRGVLPALL